MLAAQTESGSYRGSIIGETEHHVIQRQSARTSIAHPRDLLDRQPPIGESVRINYSDSKGAVREFRERAKAQVLRSAAQLLLDDAVVVLAEYRPHSALCSPAVAPVSVPADVFVS
jgi:hypothetical protein